MSSSIWVPWVRSCPPWSLVTMTAVSFRIDRLQHLADGFVGPPDGGEVFGRHPAVVVPGDIGATEVDEGEIRRPFPQGRRGQAGQLPVAVRLAGSCS